MSMNRQLLSFKSTHLLLIILVSLALFACVPGGACGGITRPAGWSSGVVQDSILYTGTMQGEIIAMFPEITYGILNLLSVKKVIERFMETL